MLATGVIPVDGPGVEVTGSTKRQFASFRASSQYLYSAAFSPDGKDAGHW